MCNYLNFFPAFRHVAETAIVKFRIGSLKRIGMNKFVRTKSHNSHTGSKFSKRYWGFYTCDGLWLCTYIAVFPFGVRWRHSKPPNSGQHFLVIFTTVLKDSLANYESISTPFATSVRGMSVHYDALNVSYFRL